MNSKRRGYIIHWAKNKTKMIGQLVSRESKNSNTTNE
jgi:hypothetical protein